MKLMRIVTLAALSAGALFAQDISGIWQGTLQAGRDLRIAFKISKADGGAMKATMHSIDQGGQAIACTATLQGSSVKISIPGIAGTYEGKLDTDKTSITGTWSQGGGKPIPFNLAHVTPEAAWPIPEPAAPPRQMAADAHLVFEVATIKPTAPGTPGKAITMRGPHQFVTINTSLNDLITFAYGIHPNQITGGASWLESEFFDIQAEPEAPGTPNRKQLEVMLQALLADRFKLTFHKDKKELSVYAITVGKNGPKLTKSAGDPNGLPGLGFRGLGAMNAVNSNMSDFAGLMQSVVLDRPVVDQTGLSGRFDFQLNWTPDASQFGGRGGAAKADDPNAPPDLFAAIQEQLGLQLKGVKTAVDVLVIDRVEKPSAN